MVILSLSRACEKYSGKNVHITSVSVWDYIIDLFRSCHGIASFSRKKGIYSKMLTVFVTKGSAIIGRRACRVLIAPLREIGLMPPIRPSNKLSNGVSHVQINAAASEMAERAWTRCKRGKYASISRHFSRLPSIHLNEWKLLIGISLKQCFIIESRKSFFRVFPFSTPPRMRGKEWSWYTGSFWCCWKNHTRFLYTCTLLSFWYLERVFLTNRPNIAKMRHFRRSFGAK